MKRILLLGASGSIGSQSLDVIEKDKEHFLLTAFSVGKRTEKIPKILKKHPEVTHIYVSSIEERTKLEKKYPKIRWYDGDEGLKKICKDASYDLAVNALVGFVGLAPSLIILERNKILALANKESLVVGGELIKSILARGYGKLYPIDSEHVALMKMLDKTKREDVNKLIITGSGGAFRTMSRDELGNVTPEMALNHPTWKMGDKITIDSATMMNKGFEVIEAMYLYDWPLDKIDIILHDESAVHSLLLLNDSTYVADISKPDMHIPIQYALYEKKVDYEVKKVANLNELTSYHFHDFKKDRYPAVGLALLAIQKGGTAPAILNAANEEAVKLFLAKKIPFLDIEIIVSSCLKNVAVQKNPTLFDIEKADRYARLFVANNFGGKEN